MIMNDRYDEIKKLVEDELIGKVEKLLKDNNFKEFKFEFGVMAWMDKRENYIHTVVSGYKPKI